MDSSEESCDVSMSMAESSSDMVLCLSAVFCVSLDALEYTGAGGDEYMGDSGTTTLCLPKAYPSL